jgi:phosphohistidine swiveling domain-containing protein
MADAQTDETLITDTGHSVVKHPPVEGVARRFENTGDVAAAMTEDLDGTIALVRAAGVSLLSPIIADVAGVICSATGEGSHLAIMAREFEIPCVMGVDLQPFKTGARVRLDCSGELGQGRVYLLGGGS